MTTTHETTGSTPSAVVWIDERHAIVARTEGGPDRISMAEIERGSEPEVQYLAHVVHEIGDQQRVMIVGASTVKLALEREFVALSHRPDRLVAAPASANGAGRGIVDRLRRLAA